MNFSNETKPTTPAHWKSGIFITGTDTDVGKTFVSALLMASLRHYSHPAGYFKPVQSGADAQTPSDLQTVVRLADLGPKELMPPVYQYKEPIAPSRAASLNGEEIQIDRIQTAWQQRSPQTWVVEGAGGLLVPLNSRCTVRDLIQALELRLILVASTRLGTINHTLLTLESIHSSGAEAVGLVLVGARDPGLVETLKDFTEVPILAEIPRFSEMSPSLVQRECFRYFPEWVLNRIFV